MAEIRLENVRKKFGDVIVLRGLDLTIESGEFFTFVGPSGCGKSTVLNLIAGLEDVTGGRILFDGVLVNDLPPKERDVAMVFQSYALYPHMSVYENIAFPLKMKKERKDVVGAEVGRVASLLGLSDLLAKKPRELSGGQQQRVALGRAIIRKPKIFLMDEPLSNLDAQLRGDMRIELKRLHQELGITTVYVTHDQSEALGLSDRIAVLHNGEIQQCDHPREVYARPANMFVGRFIGSPPMNFLPCRVRGTEPLEIECLGRTLALRTGQRPQGGEVILGIRPEDVQVTAHKPEEGLEVTVSVVEPAGSFTWVDVLREGDKIRGVLQEEGLAPNSRAYISLITDRAVMFNASSGKRL
jgi:multiple sugar transport system ATP-binding protein